MTPRASALDRLPWFGCLLLASTLVASAPEPKKPPPPPAVSVEVIAPRLFVQRLALTGTIEPATIAELSSPAEGPVFGCRVREGDAVTAGQTLLGIGRTTSVAANVTAAQEELERRQRELDRFNALATRNVLAADAVDQSRAELQRARAAVTLAQQAAADYTLKAPWAGIVSRVHVADGKYVAPRALLVDLFDPHSLVLRFQVPESHVFAIKQGDPIEARFDAFPERAFTLPITRVFPEIDRRLRTRTFEAKLPLDETAFVPGQFARIEAALQRIPDAIAAPVEAVATGTDGASSVFLVDPDGKARAVPVTLGAEQDSRVLLSGDLHAGDRLIVNGREKVRAGEPVRVAAPKPTPTDAPGHGTGTKAAAQP